MDIRLHFEEGDLLVIKTDERLNEGVCKRTHFAAPFIPLAWSETNQAGIVSKSGYLWDGELRENTPEFWAEVRKRYPTRCMLCGLVLES